LDVQIYVVDNKVVGEIKASGFHSLTNLPGWKVDKFVQVVKGSQYSTNWYFLKIFYFTFPTHTRKHILGVLHPIFTGRDYSRYTAGIRVYRGASVFILTILPPLVITLVIAGLVFLLDIEALETRFATCCWCFIS